MFQYPALFRVRVIPQCPSIMLSSLSEILLIVPAHFCVLCQSYCLLCEHTSLFCVRVTAYCASTLLCSVSGLLASFPAPCPVLCQSYCLLIQHTAVFYVIYSLVFITLSCSMTVTPYCSNTQSCSMSELLLRVPARCPAVWQLLPSIPA